MRNQPAHERFSELTHQRDDLKAHAWNLHDAHQDLHEKHQKALALIDKAFELIRELEELNGEMMESHERRIAEMNEFVAELERGHAAHCPCCGVLIDSIGGRPLNS
jgi:hypothetical protein